MKCVKCLVGKKLISSQEEIYLVADAASKPTKIHKNARRIDVTDKLCKESRWNIITSNAS